MKVLIAAFILVFFNEAFACDYAIAKFERDCKIQDRFIQIREQFAAKDVNIDEIAEYKALRFIDRASWEWAKKEKVAPLKIYEPKPITWQVWEKGINHIFNSQPNKGILYRNFTLNSATFSAMNTVLLTDGKVSIKSSISDQSKNPGDYRQNTDTLVGFCAANDKNYAQLIEKSDISLRNFQEKWQISYQQMTGVSFTVDLTSHMKLDGDCIRSDGGLGIYVAYAPSSEVPSRMDEISAFIRANLESYQMDQAILSPIELATVVQKWFVSTHPFADGNGRTSRAVQDLVLTNFDMPYVPAGDLQNDALEDLTVYLETTYSKIESMLDLLEKCVHKRDKRWRVPRACKTIEELNNKD